MSILFFVISIQETVEFISKDIPRGELHPCLEGKKPENKAKNRYTTIFPCMSKIRNLPMKMKSLECVRILI